MRPQAYSRPFSRSLAHAGPAGSESAQQRWCCTLQLHPESQRLHCSCMANKQLSIVLYRTVWRWARAANGVPYHLRFEDVCTVAPACLQPIGDAICAPSVPLQESAAVRAIARRAFRDSAHLQVERGLTSCASNLAVGLYCSDACWRPCSQGQAAEDALDRGMEVRSVAMFVTLHPARLHQRTTHAISAGPQAVRLLHHNYASDVARRRRLASQHAEREGIAHPIGTCFVHRVRGCGWVAWHDKTGSNPDLNAIPGHSAALGVYLTSFVGTAVFCGRMTALCLRGSPARSACYWALASCKTWVAMGISLGILYAI